MAQEAVCIETPTKFARYTVVDGTAITKGTLMKLSGANTAYASQYFGDLFAGIAWDSKAALDSVTEINCALDGVWDLIAGATIANGSYLQLSGANTVTTLVATSYWSGAIVGRALEAGVTQTAGRVRLGSLI